MSAPRPGRPDQPRRLVLPLAAGLSLLIAGLLLVLLQVVGVDTIGSGGFVVEVLAAAVAGGGLTRWLLPRLPPVRR